MRQNIPKLPVNINITVNNTQKQKEGPTPPSKRPSFMSGIIKDILNFLNIL